MNIISHNCVNGWIYQMKGLKYENPFVWCVIPPDDFWYLYNNYNDINYRNIKISEDEGDYKIVIDGKINVYYVHYKYDKECDVPTKKTRIDVFYNKIKKYIVNKYFTRLKRMKDKPIFVVTDRIFISKPDCSFKKEDLLKYVNRDDCIVVTCDNTIIGNNVIYSSSKEIDTTEIAQIILDNNCLLNE